MPRVGTAQQRTHVPAKVRLHIIESTGVLCQIRSDCREGISAFTLLCNDGWSKQSHECIYNAIGGVAVIIDAATGKLLYIGFRYLCNFEPIARRNFRNWD